MKKDLTIYAPAVLRYGIALVYLWFGISQLLDPNNFIGYLPDFLFHSGFAKHIIIVNGVAEIVLGALLILGLFTRIVATLLAIHLAAITLEVGLFTEVGARDFGLTIATIVIAIQGADKLCLDTKRTKRGMKK